MNKQSVFSLSPYSGKENKRKTELEPYLTKVFAYILDNYHDFCKYFLKEAFKFNKEEKIKKISTEETGEKSRFDITIEFVDKQKIIIENKIYAKIDKKQIKKYRKTGLPVYLIYKIFNKEDFKSGTQPNSYSWFKIYTLLEEYIKKMQKDEKYFLIKHFLIFLDEMKLKLECVKENINDEIKHKDKSSLIFEYYFFNQIIDVLNYLLENNGITNYEVASCRSKDYYIYSIYFKYNNQNIYYNFLISYIDSVQLLGYLPITIQDAHLTRLDEKKELLNNFPPIFEKKKWTKIEKIDGKKYKKIFLDKMDMKEYFCKPDVIDQIDFIKEFISKLIEKCKEEIKLINKFKKK